MSELERQPDEEEPETPETNVDSGWAAPQPPRQFFDSSQIKLTHALLIGIIFLAAFTRIWRLGEPVDCYFDEVYFPTTGAKILHGNDKAWNFFGSENTHPPLSKEMMAIGEAIFGTRPLTGENGCYDQSYDPELRKDPNWAYDAFGFRLPGAIFGVFSVIFMYLLARKLFKSEVAGLAASFLLSIDGLVLTQSRIATPDTYTLCLILGAMYFLVRKPPPFANLTPVEGEVERPGSLWGAIKRSSSWLIAGLFLGAAASSKWNGAFAMFPIVVYFGWLVFTQWRSLSHDSRLREAERVLLVGAAAVVVGVGLAAVGYIVNGGLDQWVVLLGGVPAALGLFVIVGGLFAVLTEPTMRNLPHGRLYLVAAASFPVCFLLIPFGVYMATYTPMFLNGFGLSHWWELNDSAYKFHSSLGTPHPYESKLLSWPIDMRPVYFYLGSGHAKIYNLGNPLVFWLAIPALIFTFWQGIRMFRVRIEPGSALRVWGRLSEAEFIPLFVVATYLAFWLALVSQKRALFLYHYQPAFAISVLAFGYTIHKLWDHPHPWARHIAALTLAACFATFVYFFPHWTAIDVPEWLDKSYFWFPSWS